jgi:hypothetical protein
MQIFLERISSWFDALGRRVSALVPRRDGVWSRTLLVVLAAFVVIQLGLAWYWSREPDPFWVRWEVGEQPAVSGFATTDTLIRVANTLLEKPGGYLSNDIAPPGVVLDNIPNWEFGVLVQVRDLARALRNDYSRSQTQSLEDPDLARAEPAFNFDSESWILPTTESKYREGIRYLERYLARLKDAGEPDAQFFSRADNLRDWLAIVEKRLGDLSQRLSASVGQRRVNTDLAGDPVAHGATPRPADIEVKTPWLQIDDVFFEARGASWALAQFLRAAEYDFREVLEDKNARVSLRQIIRELEAAQAPMRSPMVLNGSGFAIFANHSLVMASYLSRANSAVIDLRELLRQG